MNKHRSHIDSVPTKKNDARGERTELAEAGSAPEQRLGKGNEKLQIPVRRARRIRRKRKGRKHGQHAVRLGR